MVVKEEKRKIEQIPIYDEDGRIEYYKIPNYTIRKELLLEKMFKEIIRVVHFKAKNEYTESEILNKLKG